MLTAKSRVTVSPPTLPAGSIPDRASPPAHRHLSLKLSCLYRNSGASRYSITRRCPVLISAVTAIPAVRFDRFVDLLFKQRTSESATADRSCDHKVRLGCCLAVGACSFIPARGIPRLHALRRVRNIDRRAPGQDPNPIEELRGGHPTGEVSQFAPRSLQSGSSTPPVAGSRIRCISKQLPIERQMRSRCVFASGCHRTRPHIVRCCVDTA
jgi:hypothetical protein